MQRNLGSMMCSCLLVSGIGFDPGVGVTGQVYAQEAPTSQPAEAKVPDIDTLLKQHIEAVGGEDVIRSHTSMHVKGKFEMPAAGLSATINLYSMAPNKMLMVMDMPGMGEVREGCDGTVAWSSSPMMGVTLKEGKMREDALREADFYRELNYKEHYTTMEVLGREAFGDKECWAVRMVDKKGDVSTFYFDVESTLIRGIVATPETDMGAMEVKTMMDGYKEFGGITMATKMTMETMQQSMTMEFTEVTFDQVDESIFDLPEAVKELLKSEQ